jgi:hypothetical protein
MVENPNQLIEISTAQISAHEFEEVETLPGVWVCIRCGAISRPGDPPKDEGCDE